MTLTKEHRNEYLRKCKECAMICEEGLCYAKINVPQHLKVRYKGAEYYPFAYELSFGRDGTAQHFAVLHDLKANAVYHVPLVDVTF